MLLVIIGCVINYDTGRVEKGQRNKQGRMEEEANLLYRRRHQMTGQARDEEMYCWLGLGEGRSYIT